MSRRAAGAAGAARPAWRWWRRDDGFELGSLRRQIVVSTAVLGAVVALALIAVVQVVLHVVTGNAVARVVEDRADSVISSATSSSTGTRLDVPDADLDPGVAVYDRSGSVVAGEVPPSLQRTFARLSATPSPASLTVDDRYEVGAVPFTTRSGAVGVVVLAEPLAPYENDERYALVVSVVAGAIIVLLATSLAAWASRRALGPVARMAAIAEDWSEHDLDRRFDLGAPTNEIRTLGHTLDALLGRVADAIVAEQRLTSELAHELRTPLTAIMGTADLVALRTDLDAELRGDVEQVQESSRAMATTITALLDLARAQAGATGGGTCRAPDVVRAVLSEVDGRDRVEDRVDDVGLGVPLPIAVRALAPVVHNAAALSTHVVVRSVVEGGVVRLLVEDDGPGIAEELRASVFEPGVTGVGGSGLGLALARRVARGAGGEVRVLDPGAAPGVGARFEVALPLAGPAPAG